MLIPFARQTLFVVNTWSNVNSFLLWGLLTFSGSFYVNCVCLAAVYFVINLVLQGRKPTELDTAGLQSEQFTILTDFSPRQKSVFLIQIKTFLKAKTSFSQKNGLFWSIMKGEEWPLSSSPNESLASGAGV